MTSLPVSERGYAHPELLAETGWLAAHLDDPNVRIIDGRTADDYAAGHIPGAVNLSGRGGIPRAPDGEMGSSEEFERVASRLGIDNDTTVVVYDEPRANTGMLAWAFQYFGHGDVRMLDGGFAKWTAEGRPTSTDLPSYAPRSYEASVQDGACCTLDMARSALDRPGVVIWDVRSDDEFAGRAPSPAGPTARLGHIPGAVHLEWTELLDPQTRTFKSGPELTSLLASKGITPESEILSY